MMVSEACRLSVCSLCDALYCEHPCHHRKHDRDRPDDAPGRPVENVIDSL